MSPPGHPHFRRPTGRPSRDGFSLVLSLTIMALMLVVIITLVSFLKIESQLATNAVARSRARMQAMVSLRLALAHLQQEAGADRRTTARADICADTMQPGWNWTTIRNPLWTGVWRTDKPAQPPAWLVSGRHDRPAGIQSLSLVGTVAYDATPHLPWDSTYNPQGLNVVTLVGDASASAIYADAFSKDPEFYAFTRSLRGYEQAFSGTGNVLVIDPKSDFFRYLDRSNGTR